MFTPANSCHLHPSKLKKMVCKRCKTVVCSSCSPVCDNQNHELFSFHTSLMESYNFLSFIGKGGYGLVYSVQHNLDQKKYALKLIPLTEGSNFTDVVREMKILAEIDDPYIIRYHFSQYLREDPPKIAVFMELADRDLQHEIPKLDQETALKYFRQICSGIKYLHERKMMHRDLKPTNILIRQGVAKVCDFGLAKLVGEDLLEPTDKRNLFGVWKYLPPEVLNGGRYNEKCDIWALGIIFHLMLTQGLHLFDGANKEEIKARVLLRNFELSKSIKDPHLQEIILGCLKHRIEERFTIFELLQALDFRQPRERIETNFNRKREAFSANHQDAKKEVFSSERPFKKFQPNTPSTLAGSQTTSEISIKPVLNLGKVIIPRKRRLLLPEENIKLQYLLENGTNPSNIKEIKSFLNEKAEGGKFTVFIDIKTANLDVLLLNKLKACQEVLKDAPDTRLNSLEIVNVGLGSDARKLLIELIDLCKKSNFEDQSPPMPFDLSNYRSSALKTLTLVNTRILSDEFGVDILSMILKRQIFEAFEFEDEIKDLQLVSLKKILDILANYCVLRRLVLGFDAILPTRIMSSVAEIIAKNELFYFGIANATDFHGANLKALCENIRNNRSLRVLDFSNNDFDRSRSNLEILLNSLVLYESGVEELRLRNCKFADRENVLKIATLIEEGMFLRRLDLGKNRLLENNKNVQIILNAIKNSKRIEEIDLSDSGLELNAENTDILWGLGSALELYQKKIELKFGNVANLNSQIMKKLESYKDFFKIEGQTEENSGKGWVGWIPNCQIF